MLSKTLFVVSEQNARNAPDLGTQVDKAVKAFLDSSGGELTGVSTDVSELSGHGHGSALVTILYEPSKKGKKE